MKEKSPNEQVAANRQIDMLIDALENAKNCSGIWLNHTGKPMPKVYEKGPSVSPFNALVLALHSDRHAFGTNLYTSFMDSRKRGDSILGGEKGVPFFFYRWDTYVNRHDPEDKISREAYLDLSESDKALYKGERRREVRTLFNISQTTMPMADTEGYSKLLESFGGANERGYIWKEDNSLRSVVNSVMLNVSENLVPIRRTSDGVPHYDSEKNAIYMPSQSTFGEYPEYVQELMRQIVSATGHRERLAREGMVMRGGKAPSEDAVKYEALVDELASGIKMMELGLQAKLKPENMPLVEYWTAQLRENPCLIDAIETDVNNALDVIRKAERGEKVEFASKRNEQQTEELHNSGRPQVTPAEALVIQDILRHGGFKIDAGNFPGATPEERAQNKKDFMAKFCNLEYYEGQTSLALWQARKKLTDPELINVAYTVATSEASRIHRVMSEFLPKDWEQKGSHLIAEEMMAIPDRKSKEFIVVFNPATGIADVVLPECARSGGDVIMPNGDRRNYWLTPDEVMLPDERKAAGAKVVSHNIPGISKDKISAALAEKGASYVRFFNKEGDLRYRPDDAYFKGCEVYAGRLNGKDLIVTSTFDVSEAVSRATEVQFDRIQMIKDDDGKWALLLKAENEPSFSIYPDKDDCNRFFSTIKQGNDAASIAIRNELAQKYYAIAAVNPKLKGNPFYGIVEGIDASKIQRATIFRTREDKYMMSVAVEGMGKVAPRELTSAQWQRVWMADDVQAYKIGLASHIFADILPKKETAEAIKESVQEGEAVVEGKGKEDIEPQPEENDAPKVEEQAHPTLEEKENSKDEEHENPKVQENPKSKEEHGDKKSAQEESESVNADETTNNLPTPLILMAKRHSEMRHKHPDAMLLFRNGDYYFALRDDASKARDVLKLKISSFADSKGKTVSYASFPQSDLDAFLPKLVRAGHRIAICEQLDSPNSRKVERGSAAPQQGETAKPKEEDQVAKAIPHFRR